jgi:uncharacterized protein
MQAAPITSLYAALLALLFVGLSARTVRLRQQLKVLIGDGGHAQLARAARVHANFAEYLPMALLLLLLLEQASAPALGLHLFGSTLLLARAAHAIGVSRVDENLRWRIAGVSTTLTLLLGGALLLLVLLARRGLA